MEEQEEEKPPALVTVEMYDAAPADGLQDACRVLVEHSTTPWTFLGTQGAKNKEVLGSKQEGRSFFEWFIIFHLN